MGAVPIEWEEIVTTFLNRLKLGLTAFKEAFLIAPVVNLETWSGQDPRQMRYSILWAMYEQTSYRNVHKWANAYRKQYALYKYIRPIYNPAYRLGEFWKTHLFGGLLDPGAGEDGAIPIATELENLRPAIATLWKWSQWSVKKDLLTVKGTVLGDAIIRVVDDVERERVYLELLHPGTFTWIEKDPFGNVKGYLIQEPRDDPRASGTTVIYGERVSREGDMVVWETFRNGEPYAWPDNLDRTGEPMAVWREPYGFVPLVAIQHNGAGLEWGWSELHPFRAKVQEADDIASQISDSIRRTVDPTWILKGVRRDPDGSTTMTKRATSPADTSASSEYSTLNRPAPGREEMKALYGSENAGAVALVPPLDLPGVHQHLEGLLKELERDMPELSSDIHTASGDASGRALRTARQPVVSKVIQRRVSYDAAMVAIQQMGISIGGFRGYEGYQGYNLDSYARGDLEHFIAIRPVFEQDPLDEIEVQNAFYEAAVKAKKAGMPLIAYLKEAGWDDTRIAELNLQEQVEGEQEDDPTD